MAGGLGPSGCALTPWDPAAAFPCPYPSPLPYCPRWQEMPEIIQIMPRPVLRVTRTGANIDIMLPIR